jgi:hypothetical protein
LAGVAGQFDAAVDQFDADHAPLRLGK